MWILWFVIFIFIGFDFLGFGIFGMLMMFLIWFVGEEFINIKLIEWSCLFCMVLILSVEKLWLFCNILICILSVLLKLVVLLNIIDVEVMCWLGMVFEVVIMVWLSWCFFLIILCRCRFFNFLIKVLIGGFGYGVFIKWCLVIGVMLSRCSKLVVFF